MLCPACRLQNYSTAMSCRHCNCSLDVTDANERQSKVTSNPQTAALVGRQILAGTATGRTSDEDNTQKLQKVFKWLFMGWVIFFVLAWSLSNFKPAMELFVSILLAAAAALVSTLIYWGIWEFLKSNTDKDRRADAAESEIAELRRKVEELSRKSED